METLLKRSIFAELNKQKGNGHFLMNYVNYVTQWSLEDIIFLCILHE